MSMFVECEQRSPEWYALRVGRFSASPHGDLHMAKYTAGYQNAIADVAFERLTGKSSETTFTTQAMKDGIEREPFAREEYEKLTFSKVRDGGIFILDDWCCASPDGRTGKNGGLEIKCPLPSTQIYYLADGGLPKKYYWQVHFQIYVCGFDWVDFFSYHPDLKPLKVRIHRDEKVMLEIANKIEESKNAVELLIQKLK